MKTTMINIKTDKKVKEDAQKLAEELGFTLSGLITASLKQFIPHSFGEFFGGASYDPLS